MSPITFDIAPLVTWGSFSGFYVVTRGVTVNEVPIFGCNEGEPDLISFGWSVMGQMGDEQDPLEDFLITTLDNKADADKLAGMLESEARLMVTVEIGG